MELIMTDYEEYLEALKELQKATDRALEAGKKVQDKLENNE